MADAGAEVVTVREMIKRLVERDLDDIIVIKNRKTGKKVEGYAVFTEPNKSKEYIG